MIFSDLSRISGSEAAGFEKCLEKIQYPIANTKLSSIFALAFKARFGSSVG
jgi:hypothetical protein